MVNLTYIFNHCIIYIYCKDQLQEGQRGFSYSTIGCLSLIIFALPPSHVAGLGDDAYLIQLLICALSPATLLVLVMTLICFSS